MNIKKIDINLLNSSEYKPRKDLKPEDIEYKKIKRSIEKFGYVDPLILNKDMTVIGGNQRLKVLKELNYKKVDCVLLDLDKTKEKALNIALNKIEGEWDLLKLKDLLQELNTGEIDMDITGFDYTDLEKLMTQFYVPEEKDDEVPDIPEEPISKLGDLYKLGEHRLLCGDATKIEDVKRLMDGNKADMVFTDPPYGVEYEGGSGNPKKRKGMIGDIKLDIELFYRDAIGLAIKNCTKNAPFYIFYASRNSRNVFKCIENIGLKVRSVLIWNKIKAHYGAFMSHYKMKYEPLLYCSIGNASIKFFGATNETAVWDIEQQHINEYHPTQKPVALAERAIKNSSKRNDIILDLFGGSGSTLITCEKLKRKCYMMEIEPRYCDVIV